MSLDKNPRLESIEKKVKWTSTKADLTMNGTEQTVDEIAVGATWSGQIFLDNMEAGDTIVIRDYFKKEAGTFKLYSSVTYSDVQTEPVVNLTANICKYGSKVTIEQTAGTYRVVEVHKHLRLT